MHTDVQHGSTSPQTENIIFTIKGLPFDGCETAIRKAIRQIASISSSQLNIIMARLYIELDTNHNSVAEIACQLKAATGYTFEEYDRPQGSILDLLVNDAMEFCRTDSPDGVITVEPVDKHAWDPYRIFSCRGSTSDLVANTSERLCKREEVNTVAPSTSKEGYRIIDAIHKELKYIVNLFSITTNQVRSCQQVVRIHYNARVIGARDLMARYEMLCPGQNIRVTHTTPHPANAVDSKQITEVLNLFLAAAPSAASVLCSYGLLDRADFFRHIELGSTTILQIAILLATTPNTSRILVNLRILHSDVLVVISTTVAYIISLTAYVLDLRGQPLEQRFYFRTHTYFTLLILLSRLLSESARHTVARMVSFRSLQVKKVNPMIADSTGTYGKPSSEMSVQLLQYGDHFVVPRRTRIATDGKVISGGSEVDESTINGECVPVAKGHGSIVYAGTYNRSGLLVVKLSALPHENTVSRIATIVEDVVFNKPKPNVIIDSFLPRFVPFVVLASAAIFAGCMAAVRYSEHQSWIEAVVRAGNFAFATLALCCPYAIASAVPFVVLMAGGISAQHGIILKNTQKLDVARNVTDIVFSKTGVLTCGVFTVVKAELRDEQSKEIRQVLHQLFHEIESPIGSAIMEWLSKQPVEDDITEPIDVNDIKEVRGKGIEAAYSNNAIKIRVGSPQWLGIDEVESPHTLVCVEMSGFHVATFRLIDHIRMTANSVVKRLHDRGIDVHLTSGDNEWATNAVAFGLRLSKSTTRHGLSSDQKCSYVHDLQKNKKVVMFIGDSVKDAASFAQADIGVHIHRNPSPCTVDDSKKVGKATDIILMHPSRLHAIMILLDISAAVNRRIQINLVWACLYNVLALTMTASALWEYKIPPELAGLGGIFGLLPIVLTSFSLKLFNFGRRYRREEREAWGEMKN